MAGRPRGDHVLKLGGEPGSYSILLLVLTTFVNLQKSADCGLGVFFETQTPSRHLPMDLSGIGPVFWSFYHH